jgi:hypothetical protein
VRKLFLSFVATFLTGLIFCPVTAAQTKGQPAATTANPFNNKDLSGVWWVADPGTEKLLERGRTGDASKCQTCHTPEHTMPEPPLTPWAKEHLSPPNEPSHGPIGQTPNAPQMQNGMLRRNICDPIGMPAQLWYTQLSPFEFVVTQDRIFQFFENHREWRTIWMNRDHPKDLYPAYMGDSVGKWDGDTLVIDTIGFNGKSMVEPVGVDHLMSDAFHLVERWRRVSQREIEADVVYYDPKVWGDQSWGGLKKRFVFQPNMRLEENYCISEDNAKFDKIFVEPSTPPVK